MDILEIAGQHSVLGCLGRSIDPGNETIKPERLTHSQPPLPIGLAQEAFFVRGFCRIPKGPNRIH